MKKYWKIIASNRTLIRLVPTWLKNFLRRHISLVEYDKYNWDHYSDFNLKHKRISIKTKPNIKIGILKEFSKNHFYYIAACEDLGITYKVIDISCNNWIDKIRNSECHGFLVWPSPVLSIWKEMYDERVKIIVECLGKIIYPSYNEVWLYENKRRERDWLYSHNIAHPKTYIFYSLEEANEYLNGCEFPIVMKTNFGSHSNGVKILKKKKQARKIVNTAFGRGILADRADCRDKQWGNIIFQKYVHHVKEWRMVRVGDYYLCREKIKKGNFASGSGIVKWAKPSEKLLELTKCITNLGNFTSMNIDFFQKRDGTLLVNELHAFFGAIKKDNEKNTNENTGRYYQDEKDNQWKFEEGFFYQNACANLRIEYFLNNILKLKE